MRCETENCIYNKQFECMLVNISINSLGMCEECIPVLIDKAYLESEKLRQLREMEDRWPASL